MTSPLFSKSPKARVFGTLIFIALAMGWLRAQAQTTSGAVVSGTVTIDHGRVAAFRVKAKDTMRRIAYTVYTQKGRYNIYNLPAGHYEISVLEEGIEPLTQAVDLPAGKSVTANLNLRATAAAEERVGISGARAQENYGGVRGSAKATARIVDFDTLYPPGRGRDLIQLYCLGCHGPGGFHQRGFGNEATWRARVEKMFTRKSGILTDEPMIGTGIMSEEDKNGSKPYENYEAAIRELAPSAEKKQALAGGDLFDRYPTLTTKEYSVITGVSIEEAEHILTALEQKGAIQKQPVKNGVLWRNPHPGTLVKPRPQRVSDMNPVCA